MKKYQIPWKALFIAFTCSISFVHGQTLEQRQQIRKSYDLTKLERLRKTFQEESTLRRTEARQRAILEGWEVEKVNPDGTVDELMGVTPNGSPIYYTVFNVDAARSTRTDHLNTNGSLGLNLDGQNMTAHVWDGGAILPEHQEFGGRVMINDGVTTPSGGNSDHAQHVTGTIVAAGVNAAAKGMAPQAMALTHDWNNDLAEATAEATKGMLISNHSYGFDTDYLPGWIFGAYITMSRTWDVLMYNSPFYLMVSAAGNEGLNNTANEDPLNGNSAFDKLSWFGTSKNNLVVANGQDANVNTDGSFNSVVAYRGSSQGPTDDFRIKPDITGHGTSVYSSSYSSSSSYSYKTGTSMASPNVAGALLLLQQHFHNLHGNYMRAATLKGLALHTADDAGISGPDAVYGWGLLNAKAAAEAISQEGTASEIEELTLSPGQSYTFEVEADGDNPLLASISWTDPPGTANYGTANLSTPVLVNDLDIRVAQGASTFQPFLLTGVNSNGTGDNLVDPYERVDVNGASGTYYITITHKGLLTGSRQDFTLIVTGGTIVTSECTTPTGISVSEEGATTASLYWHLIYGATYDFRYREIGTTSWTTTSVTESSIALDGLTPKTGYEAQVSSKCPDESVSPYSGSILFNTTGVVLTYCSSYGAINSYEYISRVQIGSIDNTTQALAGGYGDFTSLSTDLTVGATMDIIITPGWTSTVYNESYSVWIDYNQDGTFSGSEQVFTQPGTMSTPVKGSFEIPATATPGDTRMRIAMQDTYAPPNDPCKPFTFGEVEDYTVTIDTSKTVQTITFNAIPNKTYGDVFTLQATASSGLPISFEIIGPATLSGDDEVTVTGVGTVTVRASQGGNEEYSSTASIDKVFQSGKAPLTITADDQTITYGESLPVLTITYSGFVNGEDASVIDAGPEVLTEASENSDAGSYPIALSEGTDDHYEFISVEGTLTINKALAQITFSNLEQVADGSPKQPTVTTDPAGIVYEITFDGNTSAIVAAGTYEVVVVITETNYEGTMEATFTLTEDIVLGMRHANGVKIYPNPANEQIEIRSLQDVVFEVFDLSGHLQLVGMTNTITTISELSRGVYLIKVADGSYLKLIKR